MNRVFTACLLTGLIASAHAQTVPFELEIDGSGSPRVPIIDDGGDGVVTYTVGSGVDFTAGTSGAYDKPFFCFDFSSDVGPVGLTIRDANGHVVVESPGLQSALAYDPDSDPEARTVTYSPGSETQCFYTVTEFVEGEPVNLFGLFGSETSSRGSAQEQLPLCSAPDVGPNDPCQYFANDFAAYPELELDIVIEGVYPQGDSQLQPIDLVTDIVDGDVLAYKIVLNNTGDARAESVALQEVFPSDSTFDARLLYTQGEANEPLRETGIALDPGETREFPLEREVDAALAGQIHLTAGAVNGPGRQAEWAVAQEVIDISSLP